MGEIKSLAKDTAIYGGSTILVKMISWLLTTLFTYTLAPDEFGMMTNLYAYVALFMVVLTFGMETGFFRFANQKDNYNPLTVYSTALTAVGVVVLFVLTFLQLFLPQVRPFLWDDEIPSIYIRLVLIFMSIDAFCAIPYSYLRFQQRPIKFASLRIIYIVVYTVACLFFLLLCPWLDKHHPELISWFYNPDFKLGYVLVSNLIATFTEACCLYAELFGFKYKFDHALLKSMLKYSFPLLILGIAGMSNQVVDKLIFPAVYPGDAKFYEFGIYSGCFKIAMIIMIYTQAFRYAFEPFIFSRNGKDNNKKSYADASKYFIILGLLVFLAVILYLDVIKYFIAPKYWPGLFVIPVIMMGELFFGVYYNLSLWYKLTDKTYWGAIFSVIGCVIIIAINVLLIPRYSYTACAWASFTGYLVIMLFSYFMGQKAYPIPYDLKSIGLYSGLAITLYIISSVVHIENTFLRFGFNTVLLAIYIAVVLKKDLPLSEIPFLNKFVRK